MNTVTESLTWFPCLVKMLTTSSVSIFLIYQRGNSIRDCCKMYHFLLPLEIESSDFNWPQAVHPFLNIPPRVPPPHPLQSYSPCSTWELGVVMCSGQWNVSRCEIGNFFQNMGMSYTSFIFHFPRAVMCVSITETKGISCVLRMSENKRKNLGH